MWWNWVILWSWYNEEFQNAGYLKFWYSTGIGPYPLSFMVFCYWLLYCWLLIVDCWLVPKILIDFWVRIIPTVAILNFPPFPRDHNVLVDCSVDIMYQSAHYRLPCVASVSLLVASLVIRHTTYENACHVCVIIIHRQRKIQPIWVKEQLQHS